MAPGLANRRFSQMIGSYLRFWLPLGLTLLGVLVTGLGVAIGQALPKGASVPSYLVICGLLVALLGVLWTLAVRPWGLTLLGVLIVAAGAFVTVLLYEKLPQRAELTQVSGVLVRADGVRHYRSHSDEDKKGYIAKYRLEIRSADGTRVTLMLPAAEIGEAQVNSLIGQPVVALYSNNAEPFLALYGNNTGSVWELTSGTTRITEYERARWLRVPQQLLGPSAVGGGLLALSLGVLWIVRRRRMAEGTA